MTVSFFGVGIAAYLVGVLIGWLMRKTWCNDNPDALLHVDETDDNKSKYNLMVLCPLDDLNSKKNLSVKVVTHEKHSV